MNDTPPPAAANPPPAPPAQASDEGSLALGVFLAWAIIVGGYVLIAIMLALITAVLNMAPIGGFVVLVVLPEIAAVLIAVILINRGKRRTGKGVLIGLASFAAVVLLLVAACFGLLFSDSFH